MVKLGHDIFFIYVDIKIRMIEHDIIVNYTATRNMFEYF